MVTTPILGTFTRNGFIVLWFKPVAVHFVKEVSRVTTTTADVLTFVSL